jgi:hypothetical protein
MGIAVNERGYGAVDLAPGFKSGGPRTVRIQHGSQSHGYSAERCNGLCIKRRNVNRRLAQTPLQLQQLGELLWFAHRRFAGEIFADVSG